MSRQDIMAGRAFVELALKDAQFIRGIRRAADMLKSFGQGVATFGGGMLKLGTLMLAPLAAAATHFVRTGDALGDMSERTKVAATTLAEFKYAAEKSEQELSEVEKMLTQTAVAVQKLRDGNKEMVDTFVMMKLTAADFKNLSIDQQFALIAKHLAAIGNQNRQVDLAKAIFGKMGPAMIPFMKNLEKLRNEARRKGMIPSETAIKQAGEIDDALKDLKQTASATVFELGAGFAPTVKEVLTLIQQVASSTRTWLERNRDLVSSYARLGTTLILGGGAFFSVGKGMIFVSNAMKAMASVAGGVGGVLMFPLRILSMGGSIIGNVSRRVNLLAASLVGLAGRAMGAVSSLSKLGSVAGQAGANVGRMLLGTGQVGAGLMQMGVSAGASLVRGIASGIQNGGSTLRSMLGNVLRSAIANVPREMAMLRSMVRAVIVDLQPLFGLLVPYARAAVARLAPVWAAIGPPLRKAVLTAVMVAAPIISRIVAIAGPVFARLGTLGRTAATATVNAWRMVGPRIVAGLQGALRMLNRVRAAGMSAGAAAMRAVRAGAGNIGRGLGGIASGAAGLVSMIGGGLGGAAGQFAMIVPQVMMLGGAFASLLTPMGLVAAAIAGGVYLWMRYSEVGQQTFARISAALQPLLATFQTTFGGIRDAIAGGSLQLAGEIGMAGLSVALLQGMQLLNKLLPASWADTVGKIGSQIASGDLTGAWQTALTTMSSMWASFSSGVVGIFSTAMNSVIGVWEKATSFLAKSMLDQESIMSRIFRVTTGQSLRDTVLAGTGVDMDADQKANSDVKKKMLDRANATIATNEGLLKKAQTGEKVVDPQTGETLTVQELKDRIAAWKKIAAQNGGPDTFVADAQTAAGDLVAAQANAMRQQLEEMQRTADAAAAAGNQNRQDAVQGGNQELEAAVAAGQQRLADLRKKAAEAAAAAAKENADDAANQVGTGADIGAARKDMLVTFSAAALAAQGQSPQITELKAVKGEIKNLAKINEAMIQEVRNLVLV